MMDLRTIELMSMEAAERAAKKNLQPFVVEQTDIDRWRGETPRFPFPNLGSFVPAGWREERELFVDTSGFGAPDEPALTASQLVEQLKPGRGYGITRIGQFQAYVGEFVREDAETSTEGV